MADHVPSLGSDDAGDSARGDAPALPYAKSFVVQFTEGTDARLEHASGRVEHLQTGRRSRFVSIGELLNDIMTMLASNEPKPLKRGRPSRKTVSPDS